MIIDYRINQVDSLHPCYLNCGCSILSCQAQFYFGICVKNLRFGVSAFMMTKVCGCRYFTWARCFKNTYTYVYVTFTMHGTIYINLLTNVFVVVTSLTRWSGVRAVTGLEFSTLDPRTLFSCALDGTLCALDLSSGRVLSRVHQDHDKFRCCIMYTCAVQNALLEVTRLIFNT